MEIRKIRDKNGRVLSEQRMSELINEIYNTFDKIGFTCTIEQISTQALRIRGIRINTKVWGSNISPYTGKRMNVLNYAQWIVVNTAINLIFDNLQYSAKITSLKGMFLIRDGFIAYTAEDWKEREWDNVGSIINPVIRAEAWKPSNPIKFYDALGDAFSYLRIKFAKHVTKDHYLNVNYDRCIKIVNWYYLNE